MAFVDACHREGLSVILDWVPGCFCPDERGLSQFNGENMFEAECQEDIGNLRFDFSCKFVWSFLISNAFYFFDLFHIDGLRMDVTRILYKDSAVPGEPKEIDHDGIAFVRAMTGAVRKRFCCELCSLPGRFVIKNLLFSLTEANSKDNAKLLI
jgi:1,4-alpha-glucan branching enzyme